MTRVLNALHGDVRAASPPVLSPADTAHVRFQPHGTLVSHGEPPPLAAGPPLPTGLDPHHLRLEARAR